VPFICNGGYGSILLSLAKGIPVLSSGIREGKNDVNAHVRYFGVGADLRTERPKPAKICRAVDRLLADESVRTSMARLATEFRSYDANSIITKHMFEARDVPPRLSAWVRPDTAPGSSPSTAQ
jgi:UDP:flavonoid glycosyltransferase YjiC (YdhE family)